MYTSYSDYVDLYVHFIFVFISYYLSMFIPCVPFDVILSVELSDIAVLSNLKKTGTRKG